MNNVEVNAWLRDKVLPVAEGNGWIVRSVDIMGGGGVTLEDGFGTTVTIAGGHGLMTPEYIGQLKARWPAEVQRWRAKVPA